MLVLLPSILQYDELESLREELKQKERDFEELQSVKVSQAFTDHSITPDSSIMNVRASFTEKVLKFSCSVNSNTLAYHKIPKYWDTRKVCCNPLKFERGDFIIE